MTVIAGIVITACVAANLAIGLHGYRSSPAFAALNFASLGFGVNTLIGIVLRAVMS